MPDILRRPISIKTGVVLIGIETLAALSLAILLLQLDSIPEVVWFVLMAIHMFFILNVALRFARKGKQVGLSAGNDSREIEGDRGHTHG